ncbi:helix-turn-helix domain-containing protein [Aeromonas caviae]|uniref:helix-turn-helix domain-containing protein n=1 Tax=Aeromonas caviae TaxID=648 RepID=UPI001F1A25BB|nr:helix-turn-helix domain-containing protein [Aeromonas caviae]
MDSVYDETLFRQYKARSFFALMTMKFCMRLSHVKVFPPQKNALGAQIGQLQRRGFRQAPGTLLHADDCYEETICMREQNPPLYGENNGAILKELYELKKLVRQQGQAQKEVLCAEECAELLGVSVSYVYRLTSEKRLPHYKPQGKKIYFKRDELLGWLLSHRISPDAELNEHVAKRVRQARHGRL